MDHQDVQNDLVGRHQVLEDSQFAGLFVLIRFELQDLVHSSCGADEPEQEQVVRLRVELPEKRCAEAEVPAEQVRREA